MRHLRRKISCCNYSSFSVRHKPTLLFIFILANLFSVVLPELYIPWTSLCYRFQLIKSPCARSKLGILLRIPWRVYLKRFRLLPPELFWFRIAAQATPQKIGFVFKAKFLHCFSLVVLKCTVCAQTPWTFALKFKTIILLKFRWYGVIFHSSYLMYCVRSNALSQLHLNKIISALRRLELSLRLNKIWFLQHRHSDFISAKALEKSYVGATPSSRFLQPHRRESHLLHYRNSWYFKSAKLTISKHLSWHASKITGGAKPASLASSQRAAHKHQRSPALNPPKSYSGRGVLKSLPRFTENAKNSSVTWQQTVWLPVSSGPVSQQPLRVKPVSGSRLQVCRVVPNTFRAMLYS